MLKMLITHLLLREKETVIMDMVAGLEHLGRGTAGAVDAMFAVVEPGMRSLQTAKRISDLAQGLGVNKFWVVANKVRGDRDRSFIQERLEPLPIVGFMPYSDLAIEADIQSKALYDVAPDLVEKVREIAAATL
jgi:CO dehydrogenase maturation factor